MSKEREQIKKAGDEWLKKLPEARKAQVLGVGGMAKWMQGEDWRKLIQSYSGMREAKTRIGLAANNEPFADMKPDEFKKLGTVPKGMEMQTLKYYEKLFLNCSYENAIIIAKNGDAYYVKGHSSNVNINVLGDDILKGAYMTHNHPANETRFGFSHFDVSEFLSKGIKVIRGVDYKYEYQMGRTAQTKDASYDEISHLFGSSFHLRTIMLSQKGYIDIDNDEYHIKSRMYAKKYKFDYWRMEHGSARNN